MHKVIHQRKNNKHQPYMGVSPHHRLTPLFLLGLTSLAVAGAVGVFENHDTLAAINDSNTAMVAFNDQATLTISLSDSMASIPIVPNSTGKFARTSMTVGVTTNNAFGYTLTL